MNFIGNKTLAFITSMAFTVTGLSILNSTGCSVILLSVSTVVGIIPLCILNISYSTK